MTKAARGAQNATDYNDVLHFSCSIPDSNGVITTYLTERNRNSRWKSRTRRLCQFQAPPLHDECEISPCISGDHLLRRHSFPFIIHSFHSHSISIHSIPFIMSIRSQPGWRCRRKVGVHLTRRIRLPFRCPRRSPSLVCIVCASTYARTLSSSSSSHARFVSRARNPKTTSPIP